MANLTTRRKFALQNPETRLTAPRPLVTHIILDTSRSHLQHYYAYHLVRVSELDAASMAEFSLLYVLQYHVPSCMNHLRCWTLAY